MKQPASRVQRRRLGMITAVLILSALVISVQAAEIHGQKWHDINRNAVKDAGEIGVEGVQICYGGSYGYPNTTGSIDCMVTDVSGGYSFTNVLAGDYWVWENIPPGFIQSWPSPSAGYQHTVSLASDTIVNDLDFGNYQLVPPPSDVTIAQVSGTQGGIPTVLRPGLTTLTVQKDLSTYNVVAVVLSVTWENAGNPITTTKEMSQIGTTGVWTVEIPPPLEGGIYPSGDALMTFSVNVYPETSGSEDLVQIGDIIFIDPSGQILDGCTYVPIRGALVTLYLYDPVSRTSTPCPPANLLPNIPNTLLTGEDGRYFWETAGGYYQVVAQMAGYEPGISPVVSVPPPVTGLDITLFPTGGCTQTSPVHVLGISLQQVQILPHGAEKVQIQGMFTLDAGSDGIDPAADGLNLRLFLPTGLPGSGQFYPARSSTMPVIFQATNGGWTMTQSEKARTGIQDFVITKTTDPGTFSFRLVDTQTGLANQDYSMIQLEISSGDDAGVAEIDLIENNGKFTL